MHENTLRLMAGFVGRFMGGQPGRILEVGSMDVNGTYRGIIPAGWEYTGLDQVPGPNVDFVAPTLPWMIPDGHFDAVISGQCLEHTTDPFAVCREIGRVVKADRPVCLIAPWRWDIHRHPIDCWRILPDGMEILLKLAGCADIETGTSEDDCFGIGRRQATVEEMADGLKRAGMTWGGS
mgnify:CR=1 FL=1